MKVKSFFVCALTCSMFGATYAANCISGDPAVVAKSFYNKHEDFHYADPQKIKGLITKRFYAALEQEYECAQGEICAIESVPWTDAQDGEIGKPISFKATENEGTRALVRMSYIFILGASERHPQNVQLKLERSSEQACWLISDLVTPHGQSLVQFLEKYQKEYREAK